MTKRIPDQAEKLRQLAAQEDSVPSGGTARANVLDPPGDISLIPPGAKTPEKSHSIPREFSPKTAAPIPEPEMVKPDRTATAILTKVETEILAEPAPHSSRENGQSLIDAPVLAPFSPKLEELLRFPMDHATQVIAITGGKGGVGKSNIACNLAIAMSQMKKRVMILDADLSLANVDVLLGLMPRHNLTHVIAGEKQLSEILIEGPEGIRIIPGGSGVEELSQLSSQEMTRLFHAFDGLDPIPDVLLVDTAAGINPNVMQFLSASDQVIVVTTPEPTAYTDAYALMKTLLKHEREKEIGLLINMAQDAREASEVLRLMLQMCRQFLNISFNNIGYVPRDTEVLKAVRYQKPFLLRNPNSPAAKTIRNIAATILQIDPKAGKPRGLRRFFGRLFKQASTKTGTP